MIVRRPIRRGLGVDYGPTMEQLLGQPGAVPTGAWWQALTSPQALESLVPVPSPDIGAAVAASQAAGLPTSSGGQIGVWIQQNATLLLVIGSGLLLFGMVSGGRRR